MATSILESTGVRQALEQHCVPALRRIRVEETAAEVVLAGIVPSFYYKQLAQEAALPHLGGRKLSNQLEVVRD
jgi:osmotically-inducible protein OsmY